MEKKKIIRFQIFSVIFTWILGTILHFLYEWSGDNKIIASFSAVNESTWEHLKLVFFPMLITTIVGFLVIGKDNKKFWCAKTIGIILAMSFIIVFFYTYTGIIGTNFAILDIGSFFVAVILGEYVAYKIMTNDEYKQKCNKRIAVIGLICILLCFIIFKYLPPHIGLFKDPISNGYGIQK